MPTESKAPAPRRTALLVALTLVLSTLGTLLALEGVLRIAHGDLLGRPSAARGLRMANGPYPASYDPLLGYVPTPGASGRANVWHREVTITADGVRSNGAPAPPGRPVLAVGDSFTFGDEVDDADTWPARLEGLLGRPVVNGGVFGYGFDQMTLRAERLLDRYDADPLIVSVLPEDVLRCEYAYRYSWKPYFAIEDGALALHNVPVPGPDRGPPEESWLWRAMRTSFLADLVMRRLEPDAWGVPDTVRAHRQGVDVARLLVDRLVERTRRDGRALWFVIQWLPGGDEEPARSLEERAAFHGVPVIRLVDALEPAAREAGVGALFQLHADGRVGHMKPRGNRLAARAIAARLREGVGAPGSHRPGSAAAAPPASP